MELTFRPFRTIYILALCFAGSYYFGFFGFLLVFLASFDIETS